MQPLSNPIDFSDLEGDFDNEVTRPSAEEKKYPCFSCGGSGKYQGVRVHQEKSHCFACKGKGYFKTSQKERRQARVANAKRKVTKLAEATDTWVSEHKEIHDYLEVVSSWSGFAASLMVSLRKYGRLTDNQLAAAKRMHAKTAAREVTRREAVESKPTIALSRINELFGKAQASGLKKPVLRIGHLALSLAPASGRNFGYLYVKDDDEYAGKISPEGKFMNVSSAREGIEKELLALADDPMAQAVAYGRRTGRCACCGRELTNKLSVELGIGPICREKWGL